MPGNSSPARGRHRWLVGILTFLILAATLLVIYRWQWKEEDPAGGTGLLPELEAVALTVLPGVHCLGGLEPAAAYVVETSRGLVLIDSGLDPQCRSLKSEMARLGLDWQRVRAIMLTHVHADHSQGAQHLRAATGARVYAGREDAGVLRAGGPREVFCSIFYMPEATVHPTTVDVELRGGESIRFGEVSFEVLAMPGHTSGSVCYLMKRHGLRVLFAGDVIMSLAGNVNADPRLARPLGTYAAYLPPRYHGSASAFLSSFRKLRALPAPDVVLPGHPRLDATPQNPSMSQKRWEALLDGGIREMERLLARHERDGASFLDSLPKKLLPGLYYLGDFKGAAVYGLVAASKFFVVNAPGGPGLVDFWNQRLGQLGIRPVLPAAVLLTSCDPQSTAGLRDLVARSKSQVVVARAGIGKVKEACPAGTVVVAAEDLPGKGWFDVQPVLLSGRGLAPVAYQLRWAGKTVLISGRMPVESNHEAVQGLFKDFASARGNPREYAASLQVLGRLSPDLWLPTVPVDGRNANLYDEEWQEIIGQNWQLLRRPR